MLGDLVKQLCCVCHFSIKNLALMQTLLFFPLTDCQFKIKGQGLRLIQGIEVQIPVPETNSSSRAVKPGLAAIQGYLIQSAGKPAVKYKPDQSSISPK